MSNARNFAVNTVPEHFFTLLDWELSDICLQFYDYNYILLILFTNNKPYFFFFS